jgi:hypothetical protein
MLAGLLQVHQGQVGPVDPDPAAPPLPGGAAEVARFFMDVPQWMQIGGVILGGMGAVLALVLFLRHRKAILTWLIGLPAAVKATSVAVIVAAGAAGSVAGYQVYDFVEHDNRFCTGCHVMADAYLRFEESAHVGLGCKDCHAQPRTESARQLYLWVLARPEEVGPHSPVPDARCTSCHIDDDPESQWPQIAASLGHRIHFESDDTELREVMCVSCHGVAVHEWTTATSTCGDCHEAEARAQLGRMGAETELHCVACHDFMAEDPTDLPGAHEGMAILPDAPQCMACHDMEEILPEEEFEADPHGAVCGACHNPHEQDTPFDAIGTCQDCHVDVETLTIFHTGTHAPLLPNCAECHSAHTWSVEGTQCQDCHDTVMEDPGPQAGLPEGPTETMRPRPGPRAESPSSPPRDGSGGAPSAFLHSSLAGWAHLALHESGWRSWGDPAGNHPTPSPEGDPAGSNGASSVAAVRVAPELDSEEGPDASAEIEARFGTQPLVGDTLPPPPGSPALPPSPARVGFVPGMPRNRRPTRRRDRHHSPGLCCVPPRPGLRL